MCRLWHLLPQADRGVHSHGPQCGVADNHRGRVRRARLASRGHTGDGVGSFAGQENSISGSAAAAVSRPSNLLLFRTGAPWRDAGAVCHQRLPPVHPLQRPTGRGASPPLRLQGRPDAQSRWCGMGSLEDELARLRFEPPVPRSHTGAARGSIRSEGLVDGLGSARRFAFLHGQPWSCSEARLFPFRQPPGSAGLVQRRCASLELGLRSRSAVELALHRHRCMRMEPLHRGEKGKARQAGGRGRPGSR
mmetsp:Transcript_129722/g.276784  ORF Transcript_129722/g.276784 Transcript_129722/m.276784 type:complete len:248 (+) Transcript_129722:827-1570(+)